MKKVLSINLDLTDTHIGIINQFGDVEKKASFKINKGENILKNIVDKSLSQIQLWGYDFAVDIERIGFSTIGFIDHSNGIVRKSLEFGWVDFNVKNELAKLFKNKSVSVLKKTSAEALGEFWTGSSSHFNSEIYYSINDGLNGAIVLDGKIIFGESGFAGEFGHGGIMQNFKTCECGLRNCLNPIYKNDSLEKMVKDHINSNNSKPSVVRTLTCVKKYDINSLMKAYVKNGKPKELKELLVNYFKPLFSHMSLMICALNPRAIIIGEGFEGVETEMIDFFEEGLGSLIPHIYKNKLTINFGKLKEDAALVGAAYYAINDWDY